MILEFFLTQIYPFVPAQVQKEILAFLVLQEVLVTLDQRVTQDSQGCLEVLAVPGPLALQVLLCKDPKVTQVFLVLLDDSVSSVILNHKRPKQFCCLVSSSLIRTLLHHSVSIAYQVPLW